MTELTGRDRIAVEQENAEKEPWRCSTEYCRYHAGPDGICGNCRERRPEHMALLTKRGGGQLPTIAEPQFVPSRSLKEIRGQELLEQLNMIEAAAARIREMVEAALPNGTRTARREDLAAGDAVRTWLRS